MNDYYFLKYAIYIFESDRFFDLIYSKFGMKFIIHTKENGHNSHHVHIKYQNYEVVFDINSGEVIVGNIPQNKIKYAKEWIKFNKTFLLDNWNRLVEGI